MAAAAVVVVVAEDLAVPLAVGEEEAVAVKVSSQKPSLVLSVLNV